MATSSITANFEITDPKAARAFVDGLWKAYRMKPPRRPKNVQFVSVTDPDEIRALMSKWKSRKKDGNRKLKAFYEKNAFVACGKRTDDEDGITYLQMFRFLKRTSETAR